ncbi:MAG: primary-amine oxidase [Cellvibrionaceae bacterium]|jgi:primary-amine oxidase
MTISHPLDPLSAAEIQQAVALAKSHSKLNPNIAFNIVQLHEPAKALVHDFSAGDSWNRQAFLIVLDKPTSQTFELIISLSQNIVESISHIPGVKPSVMEDELFQAEQIIKENAEFLAALVKRGITNFDLVSVDTWAPGYYGDPAEDEHRLCRGVPYLNTVEGDNFYARPIENLLVLIDINMMQVIRIDDYGALDIPTEPADFRHDLLTEPDRTDIRPLDIVQPEGVSFNVDGWQIKWQKWEFRISFNHREGLVLHQVGYAGVSESDVRPILYRASLAEMTVPYGDPGVSHYRKNAFDAGEYGLGMLANSLTLGCDCLGEIYYFDADLVRMNGDVHTIKNAICLHEEDYSILWKHVDVRAGRTEVRRSRRLVVSFIATVGNYEYGFYWNFYQDGNLQLDVKLTGILQTAAYEMGAETPFGSPLNDQLYAPNHQHFFCVRMDTAVDGDHNSVVETDTIADPMGPTNPHGNAFYGVTKTFKTEREAQRLIDPFKARFWSIVNPNKQNKVGRPTGYKLVAGENCLPFAQPGSWIHKRAGYMFKHLWVTPFDPDERYPGGRYPYQSPGPGTPATDGLPEWTAADRPIENSDIVVWYVMGHNHIPRLEDWPVMPTAQMGFLLKPSGFFDKSPAMDVPPSHRKHCH